MREKSAGSRKPPRKPKQIKMTTDKKNMTTSYKTPKIKESKNALLLHFFSQFHPRRSFETKLVLPSTKNLFTHSLVENLSFSSFGGAIYV